MREVEGEEQVFAVDVADGATTQLTTDGAGDPDWQPAADLKVAARARPMRAVVGRPLTMGITVRDASPLAANAVRVSISIPVSLRLTSVASRAGSCVRGRRVTCNLGRLGGNATATITLRTTPRRAGVVSMRVVASSTTPEAVASDNTATIRANVARALPGPH